MHELTDTHCHIHEAAFELIGEEMAPPMWAKSADPNPDAMISRAKLAGVTRMICAGTTLRDSKQAIDFVATRPMCWASIGIHPHEATAHLHQMADFAALLQIKSGEAIKPSHTDKIVAIGECGLDYFYHHSPKEDQQKVLRAQIELALQYDLPMIFHVREAFDDFWPIFEEYHGIRGVLHSFTDNYANFQKAMERGLYIGVNGIMTFTKNDEQLQIAKEVPLQKLLLETDAPFLTPKPLRGTVNEPAHVSLVTQFLADLRNESAEEIARQTTKNARHLFTL